MIRNIYFHATSGLVKVDPIEDLDALDGIQAVGRVTCLDIRHPGSGSHTQNSADSRGLETVVEFYLFPGCTK
jgi:hypothetical protein